MRRRRAASAIFHALCAVATLACIAILIVLLAAVAYRGWPYLNGRFLSSLPSRKPENAGIYPALMGSLWLMVATTLIAVPVGVGAAIYLEEIAKPSRWRSLVQINIANLAGVPSVVFGVLGLGLLVHGMQLGSSVLAGALTLALVVLPIIILASQEALRSVPASIRRASFALGATRWQTIWHQVLPAALPGMMTGIILAISRAIGEAAPLLLVGVVAYVPFAPRHPLDEFSALPVVIYGWTDRPQVEFHKIAAAGILVLLGVLILMNAIAVFVRQRYARRVMS